MCILNIKCKENSVNIQQKDTKVTILYTVLTHIKYQTV